MVVIDVDEESGHGLLGEQCEAIYVGVYYFRGGDELYMNKVMLDSFVDRFPTKRFGRFHLKLKNIPDMQLQVGDTLIRLDNFEF